MAESPPPRRETRDILVFESASGVFAIDPAWVVHVFGQTPIVPTPFSARALVGLSRYGGEPLPVLSFDALIGGQAQAPDDHRPVIVVQYLEDGSRRRVGLAVEKILEMVTVEAGAELEFDDRGVSKPVACSGRETVLVDVGVLIGTQGEAKGAEHQ